MCAQFLIKKHFFGADFITYVGYDKFKAYIYMYIIYILILQVISQFIRYYYNVTR